VSAARVAGAAFISLAALSVAFYASLFASIVSAGEVFHRLGFDWTMFYAQAMALRAGSGPAMYDLTQMNVHLAQLAAYYPGPAEFHTAQPVPYPPWFAAMVVPFTLPSPPIGFALWELASFLAALWLAYRAHQLLPRLGFLAALLVILAAAPVATNLYMGQVALLLAIPVAEMLISFRAQKDFRAGLWLSVLLIKPQYVVLFGVLILFKRRWSAVAGAIVGGVSFIILGLLTAGPLAYLGLPTALSQMSDFRGLIGGPWWMINWRALVLAIRPGIGEQTGLIVVLALSLLTILVSLTLWRGPWEPKAPSFAPRFCLLVIATLLTSYHSHLHGAALLAVPIAAAWATPNLGPATRAALLASIYVPTLVLAWVTGVVHRLSVSANTDVPLWYVWPNALPAVLFLVAFALLSLDLVEVRLPLARVWHAHA
jgi:hypothetical protein